jgi:hypothetical protein
MILHLFFGCFHLLGRLASPKTSLTGVFGRKLLCCFFDNGIVCGLDKLVFGNTSSGWKADVGASAKMSNKCNNTFQTITNNSLGLFVPLMLRLSNISSLYLHFVLVDECRRAHGIHFVE